MSEKDRYPKNHPIVVALEKAYNEWAIDVEGCHELGCGCVTVDMWRELQAPLHELAVGAVIAGLQAANKITDELISQCREDSNTKYGHLNELRTDELDNVKIYLRGEIAEADRIANEFLEKLGEN